MQIAPIEPETRPGEAVGRRERKKLETRTALHRAALDLFAKNGFRDTRISEIVDVVDVSESTFFRYFDSKEGVALEGIRQRAEAIVAAVRERPVSESPIDACLAVNRSDQLPRHRVKPAGVPWAAVPLADKLDTLLGLFLAGERPTGSRDPFGLRRQAHGVIRVLAIGSSRPICRAWNSFARLRSWPPGPISCSARSFPISRRILRAASVKMPRASRFDYKRMR